MPEMINPEDVQPSASAETPEATPESTSEIPGPVLKIPAVHALLQGSPPAFYVASNTKDKDILTLEKHTKDLNKAGIGAFAAQSKPGNVVVYNGLVLPTEEIQQADQNNQLDSIAVPWEQLKESYSQTDAEQPTTPAVTAAGVPTGETPASGGAPPPAGAQSKLLQKRIANLALGSSSPTSGPRPGAGRILNTVTQPAI